MKQLGWYALQIAIVGGITAVVVYNIYPLQDAVGEPRTPLHIPVLIGLVFAAGATYAINDIRNWLTRRKQRRR